MRLTEADAKALVRNVATARTAAHRAAFNVDRRKLDLLINLRLHDAARTDQSLHEVMLEVSRRAQQRGITPAILQDILDEG